MNWLDVVIIATIVGFALAGLTSGLVREGVTFFAAIVGVVVAGTLYKPLADDLSIFTTDTRITNIIAFIAMFMAVFLAGYLLAVLLKRAASLLMLGTFDHLAGLFLGFLKGFVVIEAALILFTGYRIAVISPAIDHSFFSAFFLDGLPVLLSVLPNEFRVAVERLPT